ncbi:MAG: hypothetical protein WC671_01430 [Candidatus Paceibacterota bacterium]|jgi:flagellar basal body-associated protein FliL
MEIEKKSNGVSIGIVVIVLILIIGGIFIWKSNKNLTTSENITIEDSADLNTLEADLQTTDTNTGVDLNSVN